MNFKTAPFKAVDRLDSPSITISDLAKNIEEYIQALFPENGIEYWHNDHKDRDPYLIPVGPARDTKSRDTNCCNVVCYVHSGSNEGSRLQVSFQLGNGQLVDICSAKTFGSDEESWLMARASKHYLESLFDYEEVPILPVVYRAIPKKRFSGGLVDDDAMANSNIRVVISDDNSLPSSLILSLSSGEVIYERKANPVEGGKYFIEHLQQDVERLLSRINVDHTITMESIKPEVEAEPVGSSLKMG